MLLLLQLFSRLFSYTGAAHFHGWELLNRKNAMQPSSRRNGWMKSMSLVRPCLKIKIKLRDLPKLHAQRTVTLVVYVEGRLVAKSKWRGLSAI